MRSSKVLHSPLTSSPCKGNLQIGLGPPLADRNHMGRGRARHGAMTAHTANGHLDGGRARSSTRRPRSTRGPVIATRGQHPRRGRPAPGLPVGCKAAGGRGIYASFAPWHAAPYRCRCDFEATGGRSVWLRSPDGGYRRRGPDEAPVSRLGLSDRARNEWPGEGEEKVCVPSPD